MNALTVNIIISIVSTIIGAIVGSLFKEILDEIRARKSYLTGEWLQIIYDKEGNIIKRDTIKCRHLRNNLQGKIKRIAPKEQNFKEWKFGGKIRRNYFFGIFWSTDVTKNPASYGTLQLYILSEKLLRGFYVKLIPDSTEETKLSETLIPIRFEWQRIEKGQKDL